MYEFTHVMLKVCVKFAAGFPTWSGCSADNAASL